MQKDNEMKFLIKIMCMSFTVGILNCAEIGPRAQTKNGARDRGGPIECNRRGFAFRDLAPYPRSRGSRASAKDRRPVDRDRVDGAGADGRSRSGVRITNANATACTASERTTTRTSGSLRQRGETFSELSESERADRSCRPARNVLFR